MSMYTVICCMVHPNYGQTMSVAIKQPTYVVQYDETFFSNFFRLPLWSRTMELV